MTQNCTPHKKVRVRRGKSVRDAVVACRALPSEKAAEWLPLANDGAKRLKAVRRRFSFASIVQQRSPANVNAFAAREKRLSDFAAAPGAKNRRHAQNAARRSDQRSGLARDVLVASDLVGEVCCKTSVRPSTPAAASKGASCLHACRPSCDLLTCRLSNPVLRLLDACRTACLARCLVCLQGSHARATADVLRQARCALALPCGGGCFSSPRLLLLRAARLRLACSPTSIVYFFFFLQASCSIADCRQSGAAACMFCFSFAPASIYPPLARTIFIAAVDDVLPDQDGCQVATERHKLVPNASIVPTFASCSTRRSCARRLCIGESSSFLLFYCYFHLHRLSLR